MKGFLCPSFLSLIFIENQTINCNVKNGLFGFSNSPNVSEPVVAKNIVFGSLILIISFNTLYVFIPIDVLLE